MGRMRIASSKGLDQGCKILNSGSLQTVFRWGNRVMLGLVMWEKVTGTAFASCTTAIWVQSKPLRQKAVPFSLG